MPNNVIGFVLVSLISIVGVLLTTFLLVGAGTRGVAAVVAGVVEIGVIGATGIVAGVVAIGAGATTSLVPLALLAPLA